MYDHVITDKPGNIDFTEQHVKDHLILTGRFPPFLSETCESAAIDYFGPDGNNKCPGITQLQEDQRPIKELHWPRHKPSTFSLTDFQERVTTNT